MLLTNDQWRLLARQQYAEGSDDDVVIPERANVYRVHEPEGAWVEAEVWVTAPLEADEEEP